MKLQTLLLWAIFSLIFLVSGCASKNMQAQNTGFFEDYEQFDKQTAVKADLSKYKKIIVVPIEVMSAIAEDKQTEKQKKLYKEISEYLLAEYKKEIKNSARFVLTETSSPNTIMLETGISTVEVHFDDASWNQITPIQMGLNVVSFNAYMDGDVRILGEKRLVDAETKEVISRSMNIQKNNEITISGETIEFKDVKPALDSWLAQVKEELSK